MTLTSIAKQVKLLKEARNPPPKRRHSIFPIVEALRAKRDVPWWSDLDYARRELQGVSLVLAAGDKSQRRAKRDLENTIRLILADDLPAAKKIIKVNNLQTAKTLEAIIKSVEAQEPKQEEVHADG